MKILTLSEFRITEWTRPLHKLNQKVIIHIQGWKAALTSFIIEIGDRIYINQRHAHLHKARSIKNVRLFSVPSKGYTSEVLWILV